MPRKDPEAQRAYMRQWYARTKDTRRTPERVAKETSVKAARRRANIEWYRELKTTLRCNRCGEDHPGCLVFHHADPLAKEITVAIAILRGWSRKRVLEEIAKCEVLCANCHAKHHARERAAGA